MTAPVPDFLRQLESLPIPASATDIERRLLANCQAKLKALYDAGQAFQAIEYEPIVDCLIKRIQAAEKHHARVIDLLTANNAGAKPATFRLEVGKEYVRRDGTGPVKIVSKGTVFFSDDTTRLYYENSSYTKINEDPRDLVALWQAEAQAPQTDKAPWDLPKGKYVKPQTDADDLVHRLRDVARDYRSGRVDHTCSDAADRIEALKARVTDAEHMCAIATADYANEKARADKAEARAAKLDELVNSLCLIMNTKRDDETIRNVRAEKAEARVAELEIVIKHELEFRALKAEARVARLEDALRDIVALDDGPGVVVNKWPVALRTARIALRGAANG